MTTRLLSFIPCNDSSGTYIESLEFNHHLKITALQESLELILVFIDLKLKLLVNPKPPIQGPHIFYLPLVSSVRHPRAKCWVFLYLANAVGVNFLFLFLPSSSLLPLQFLSEVGLFIMSGLFHDPGADHHLSD